MSELDNIDVSNARDKAKYKPLTEEQRKKKQQRFLKAYAECGIVKHACKIAGISRQTFKNWRDHDEAFKSQLPDAEEDANDTLEYAAYEQAKVGTLEYVVSAGKVMYGADGQPLMNVRYSPQLLITLLKARMPNKYKDKSSVEHSGSIDVSGAKETLLAKLVPEEDGS